MPAASLHLGLGVRQDEPYMEPSNSAEILQMPPERQKCEKP